MKKKLIIIVGGIIVVIGLFIGLYFYGLSPVSKSKKTQEFTIQSGTGKMEIITNLKSSGLIRSKISLSIYVTLNKNMNLQAGTYELSPNLGAKEILKRFQEGKVIENNANTKRITFVEGKRLPYYAEKIAEVTETTEEEVMEVLSDSGYLQELINKYWFLTDEILNPEIYYPLEGYLFPSTYEFYLDCTIKDVIGMMLDTFGNKMKSYQTEIEDTDYTLHEILTMASIVEVEGSTSDDRSGVAGVFYNRLEAGWSLGSDATTYYAEKIEFSERDLYSSEISSVNAYNTRPEEMAGKLPIGPICSPSMEALIATIEPEEHDYYYFVADKNKKTYFTKTGSEHNSIINELKSSGLWYTYN